MNKATFKKDDLLAVLDDDCETLEKVSDAIVDNSRWSIQHSLIFKDKASGKFYAAGYSVGATEQQDEGPWEHDGDDIVCAEVRPVEKVVIVYKRVAE